MIYVLVALYALVGYFVQRCAPDSAKDDGYADTAALRGITVLVGLLWPVVIVLGLIFHEDDE